MKKLFKQLIFGVLSAAPRLRFRASILMYHSVGENAAEFTVSSVMFKRQLQYVLEHRYSILPLSELVAKIRRGEPVFSTLALTFDDGYEDLYTVVFPIIQEKKVPISIFLSTGFVGDSFTTSRGNTLPMLTWDQVQEMHDSGLVEFLPHGRMHHSLSTLSDDEAREEVLGSLRDLEQHLGSTPRIYAYAKGKYTSDTLRLLEEESFEAAVTVRPGYISAKSSVLELPRNHMDAHTSFAEFKARVRGWGAWYERIKLKS